MAKPKKVIREEHQLRTLDGSVVPCPCDSSDWRGVMAYANEYRRETGIPAGEFCGKHVTCKHRDALKALLVQIEAALVPEEYPWDSRDLDAEYMAQDAYLMACGE